MYDHGKAASLPYSNPELQFEVRMRPFLKLAKPDPPSFEHFTLPPEAAGYEYPAKVLEGAELYFIKAITLIQAALKQSDSDAVGKVLSEDAWDKVSASLYRATPFATIRNKTGEEPVNYQSSAPLLGSSDSSYKLVPLRRSHTVERIGR